MKNIPEINHCVPNPDAYWCRECKARTGFDISYEEGSEHGSQRVERCQVCELRMSKSGEHEFFMFLCFGCCGLFVIGGLLGVIGVFGVNTGSDWWAALSILVFGAFWGLGGWGFSRLKAGWTDWCASQERKTASQLEREGLNHPFQAEFEDSKSFYDWAGQFFDSDEEWERFEAKYWQGKMPGFFDEGADVLSSDDSPASPPPADSLDD